MTKSEDTTVIKQYNKPFVKNRKNLQQKPDLIVQSDYNKMQRNWDANRGDFVESTNSVAVDSFRSTPMNHKMHETPAQEAKKILEEFEKEISPYNTFVVSKEVIDSDGVIKQTLELFPEVRRSLRNISGGDKTPKPARPKGVVIEDQG